jgi:hypothetical protein
MITYIIAIHDRGKSHAEFFQARRVVQFEAERVIWAKRLSRVLPSFEWVDRPNRAGSITLREFFSVSSEISTRLSSPKSVASFV